MQGPGLALIACRGCVDEAPQRRVLLRAAQDTARHDTVVVVVTCKADPGLAVSVEVEIFGEGAAAGCLAAYLDEVVGAVAAGVADELAILGEGDGGREGGEGEGEDGDWCGEFHVVFFG